MVNAAETDIISPSVAAEYPLGLLGQEIFVLYDILADRAVDSLKSGNQLVRSRSVERADSEGIQPFLAGRLYFLGSLVGSVNGLYLCL